MSRGLGRVGAAAALIALLGLPTGSPVVLAWAAAALLMGAALWLSLPGPRPFLRWLLLSSLGVGALELARLEGTVSWRQAAGCCLAGGAWLALALGWLAWRDPPALLHRAGEEPDPGARLRLLRRVLSLSPGQTPALAQLAGLRPGRPGPLPEDEGQLLRRLEDLSAPGAHEGDDHAPRPGLRARARATLLQGAGAALLPAPLLAWPLGLALGPLDGGLALHALAAALALWGTLAVVGERLSARLLSGAAQGAASGLGLVLGALGGALLVARSIGLARGQDAVQPGQALLESGQRLLGALPGDRLAPVLCLLAGLIAPAACWAALAQGPAPRLRGRPPSSRWLSTRDLAAPWVIGLVVVLALDELAIAVWVTTRPTRGWGVPSAALVSAFSPLLVTGHLTLVALAWAGLALLDPRPRAGRRRTAADERRRVVARLVALRAARLAAAEGG